MMDGSSGVSYSMGWVCAQKNRRGRGGCYLYTYISSRHGTIVCRTCTCTRTPHTAHRPPHTAHRTTGHGRGTRAHRGWLGSRVPVHLLWLWLIGLIVAMVDRSNSGWRTGRGQIACFLRSLGQKSQDKWSSKKEALFPVLTVY